MTGCHPLGEDASRFSAMNPDDWIVMSFAWSIAAISTFIIGRLQPGAVSASLGCPWLIQGINK